MSREGGASLYGADSFKSLLADWGSLLFSSPSGYRAYVEKWERSIGSFLEFVPDRAQQASSTEGPLEGVPFGVKDNIAVSGFHLTGACLPLRKFLSPCTATAVTRLQKAGAVVVGKTNLDELAMGASCDSSALLQTSNPWDFSRVAGGSSGGSAAAVAAGLVPFALGSDTGGSARQPATLCGVYGLRPTPATIPRHGLLTYAPSLDEIGILAESVDMCELAFRITAGLDPWRSLRPNRPIKSVGLLDGNFTDPLMQALWVAKERLKGCGYKTSLTSETFSHLATPTYCVLANTEGYRSLMQEGGQLYESAEVHLNFSERLERAPSDCGLGFEAKLRLLLGSFLLSQNHPAIEKAQAARGRIVEEFNHLFASFDLLVAPSFPRTAWGHGKNSPLENKEGEWYQDAISLAGLPALAIPLYLEKGLPYGLQLVAPAGGEMKLFEVARALETFSTVSKPKGFSTPGELLSQQT